MLEVKKANIKIASGATRVEPAEYLKRAEVDGNTLTLTNKDDSVVEFTPQGGGADIPVTTNLLKGDGAGNIVAAAPGIDYVNFDRDNFVYMVKNGYRFTARENFISTAGNQNQVHGGTVDIKGYQEIFLNSPVAKLNGKDIAVVDDIAAAAGNWYHYDWGNRGIMKYDYLMDGSTITDWDAATSLPSFMSPALTLGADLFNLIYQLEWNRAEILELRPHLIEIFNLLKENNLLSADAVIYTVRSSFLEEPISANFGKLGSTYHFIQTRYDGSQLIAEWNDGAADFTSFQVYYGNYPYADDVNLSSDKKAAIQSNLGIVSESAIDNKLAQLMRFYEVTVEGTEPNLHFVKDGVTLTYADLVSKYEDPQYFLYVEYQGLTFIPSLPPMVGDEILEFTCQWIYGDKVQTSRLIINESNQVKYETKICAEQPTKHVYTRNTGTLTVEVEDNSEYEFNACYDVHLVFPNTPFESHITFNFGDTFNVVFPTDARYIGGEPQFEGMTSWEVSIKNGVIVTGKVE